ncbi:hypothetical protein RND81_07G090100 [Saponaria officinalis]|uniref:Glycosyltransferase n=1 Tax=Saponaria officinalis TaxID=3572 RepID=A0AAW1JQJ4_SAPOF
MEIEKMSKKLNIVMYPWFPFGHITPYLRLANKLAKKGHTISLFLPNKALQKLASQNHYPNLITLIPITLPEVDGLPAGAETTADFPFGSEAPLWVAFDSTRSFIESYLSGPLGSSVDIVFFDYACWLPSLARERGIKSVFYVTGFIVHMAYVCPLGRGVPQGVRPLLGEAELKESLPGFPSASEFKLRAYEAQCFDMTLSPSRSYFWWRLYRSVEESDGFCYKTCREMEGDFGDFFEKLYKKPVFWAGPALPEPSTSEIGLDESVDEWLKGFDMGRVVYVALGSELGLEIDHFHELVLGLELTGLPFFAVLKPPKGYDTVESALPEGFLERMKQKGRIHDGWVQQQLILTHPSIGCFVTQCGAASLSEALISQCQLVLLPQRGDQITNARSMGGALKVGVEVEIGDEDSYVARDALSKAILTVMEPLSEVGRLVRANHTYWRDFLTSDGLEDSYISRLVEDLRGFVG